MVNKKIVKIRKMTMVVLMFFVVSFGLWSVFMDFGVVTKTIELSLIVTLLFSAIISTEVLARAVWKISNKKPIAPFEVTAFSIMVLALLPSVLGLFDITSAVLTTFAGSMKVILIITGIGLVFTRQEGE